MQPDVISLSEVSKREITHDITYMWNLKYGTNEPIYRIETDSQTQSDCQGVGVLGRRTMDWEFGVSGCKLIYLEWINNKVLPVYLVYHKELYLIWWDKT